MSFLFFIYVSFAYVLNHFGKPDPICCTADQWEATLFYDNGNAFIDAFKHSPSITTTSYSYINASIKAAYDYVNSQSFLNISAVEISPLIPNPVTDNTIFLRDYKNGIQYQITGNKCEKSQWDSMQRLCIPEDATHLGFGKLGEKGVAVATYAYTLSQFPYQIQSTFTVKGCQPVHIVYVELSSTPGSGSLNSLEISDVTLGIKDPSIFTIPPECSTAKMSTKKFLPYLIL